MIKNLLKKAKVKIYNSEIFAKVTIWAFVHVFNGKMRKEIEPKINEFYKRLVRESFIIKTEIIKVKKGRIKYDLLFIETPEMKKQIILKRHWKDTDKFEIEI